MEPTSAIIRSNIVRRAIERAGFVPRLGLRLGEVEDGTVVQVNALPSGRVIETCREGERMWWRVDGGEWRAAHS